MFTFSSMYKTARAFLDFVVKPVCRLVLAEETIDKTVNQLDLFERTIREDAQLEESLKTASPRLVAYRDQAEKTKGPKKR